MKLTNYLNKKKSIVIIVIILIILVMLVMFLSKKNKLSNLNLIANSPVYKMQKNAYQSYLNIKKKWKLEGVFKSDDLNIFYKKQKWNGRIRYNDISYHAFFTVNNSEISYSIKGNDLKGINFKIFNPKNSVMTYFIDIKINNKKKQIFKKHFSKKALYSDEIYFPEPVNGDLEIIFSSTGKGLGAWINPRLIKQKKDPNIVVIIMVDTLRYDHTSLFGYHRKTTPFLKELAKDSVFYNNAFSTTSWTLPAHVSLFSGKNLTEHGVIAPTDIISWKYPLLAEIFQKKGFVTAAFTGGGFVEDSYGFYRGFQYYSNVPGRVFSMKSAERVFSHFKNYISRFKDNDLFVFLHTYQVHAPYKAPRDYINRIKKNVKGNLIGISKFIKDKKNYFKPINDEQKQLMIDLYDASILYTDEVLIGNVMNYLKEKGHYDNATIAVLSDHGEEFYDHGSWEHGHTVYGELTKIPLIIKFPSNSENKKNIVDNKLTSISDIPGIILKENGFDKNQKDSIQIRRNNSDYLIPILLPVSPIIKQITPKISFMTNDFHFIYNKIDKNKLSFFDPSPVKKEVYELYEHQTDKIEEINVYKTHLKLHKKYKTLIKKYLNRLEKINTKKHKIDEKLKKKLKSLGYLGN